MISLQGKGVSAGVAIGPLYYYRRAESAVRRCEVSDPAAEWERFKAAQEKAIGQLGELAEKAREEILAACPDASVGIEETSALGGDFDLMINATPVGMYPKTEACAVPDSIIERCGSFFDAVYNPTDTLLIRKAKALGRTAVGGAAMLVYQAVKAHEIWYGGEFSPDDIAPIITAVEDAVAEMNK